MSLLSIPILSLFLCTFSCVSFCMLASAEPAFALPSNLRVKLFEAHGRIESVKVLGPFDIVSPVTRRFSKNEWVSVEVNGGRVQMVTTAGAKRVVFAGRRIVVQPLDRKGVRIRINRDGIERSYLGHLNFSVEELQSQRKHLPVLSLVNDIPTLEYVASVVGSESPLRSPPEAMKALAVLTLSIVERKGERSLVGDSTREQAYKGCEHATPAVFAAVKSVYRQRLLYGNSPIQIFFHSTCAGGTSSGADIFGEGAKAMSYLKPVNCVYCTESPFWKSKVSKLPVSTLRNAFDGRLPVITKFDSAKRPLLVTCGEGAEQTSMSGYEAWLKIGRTYGWGVVPGTRYTLERKNVNGKDVVLATSSGAGHGVGLCQWGAVGLAKRGKKFDEILKFYFPGCELRTAKKRITGILSIR